MDFFPLSAEIGWPVAIGIAWIAGELSARWIGLPRISIYGLTGFILAYTQGGLLPAADYSNMLLLANIAFGLILYEFGYRINVRWVRCNPWIGVTGLTEAAATFIIVYWIAQWYGTTVMNSLLLASLAMSTSPAGVMSIINEQHCEGQVTERLLHLTAINCVLAVFAFKVTLGFSVFHTSGNLWQAISSSLILIIASILMGSLFGILIPGIMRWLGNIRRDGTVVFALSVILLVAIAHTLKLSPVLATLTFGMVSRHRRVVWSQAKRNFGALGELFTVLLFVYVVSTLDWKMVWAGSGLALLLIIVRIVTKISGVVVFAHISGISIRKGLLTGLALSPISVFIILVMEEVRYMDITLVDELATLAAMTLFMEMVGPILTQRALKAAQETQRTTDL